MTTFDIGRQAEAAAAAYLQTRGFKVLEQNWRTRWCEIDIIAQKNKTVYFVEVKYRQSSRQGSGLEYITAKKLKQMRFAAEAWVRAHGWNSGYPLAPTGVIGQEIPASHFIASIFCKKILK